MTVEYEEVQDIVPPISSFLMALTLVATTSFCAAISLLDPELIGIRWTVLIGALSAAGIFLIHILKIRTIVEDGVLTVRLVRKITVPLEQVIDIKTGDIDILRNYSGWGIKKITFKTFAANGVDTAVSLKLTGRRVLTMTTRKSEDLVRVLGSRIEED